MKQPYQWPDVNILSESAWKHHDWPLLENLTDEDLKNFDKMYSNVGVNFNIFLNNKRVAPALY